MIELHKKRGETPLQALTRLRTERPELVDETLSYAGRLDPMAEGILPVLVGKEENKNRKDFLSKDKEYEVHFLIGCSTDTGDVLGIVSKTNFEKVQEEKIKHALQSLALITTQTYPWYSSKPVDGISLFEHARAGRFDIERPTRDVKIYSVSQIKIQEVDSRELLEQNIKDVRGVIGDFRQDEIGASWENVICPVEYVQIPSCILRVSSGTYIRGLVEELEKQLERPIVVQRLIRTSVF